MNQIPFPEFHDMDDLNTWLDARVVGPPIRPANEVEAAAESFHALAERARATVPGHRVATSQGAPAMYPVTTAATPPISHRTRRLSGSSSRKRRHPWVSAAIVLTLVMGTSIFAVIDGPGGPGGNRNGNLAYAPLVASPTAQEPLRWTAPISPSECPDDEVIPSYDPDNPSGVLYTQDDYDEVSSERDYEITGPADPEDAEAVVSRMRQVQGCAIFSRQLPWWSVRFEYENRTTAGRATLEEISDQRATAADVVATWYENDLGLTPADMWVIQNPTDLTLDGAEALVTQGLFNPDHAVQFADGRLGIIQSVVTYESVELEIAPYYSQQVLIFVLQDGQWMLDEHLPICFGDCRGMSTPVATGNDFNLPFSMPAQTLE